MTEVAAWSLAADPGRRLGAAIEYHAQIGSTNDRARASLAQPGGERLAIVADEQTSGRGRHGRVWLSPPGRNLMVSTAFRPRLDLSLGRLLGFSAALAAQRACSAHGSGAAEIRWPNDIVDAEGRKMAGLLVETAVEGEGLAEAVIGVGINVNWRAADMPADIAARSISLADLAGRPVDRVALLRTLLDALDAEVRALEQGHSPITRFRLVSWLDGRQVEVDVGQHSVQGRVDGIGEDGALLVDDGTQRHAVLVGEVVRVTDVGVTAARS